MEKFDLDNACVSLVFSERLELIEKKKEKKMLIKAGVRHFIKLMHLLNEVLQDEGKLVFLITRVLLIWKLKYILRNKLLGVFKTVQDRAYFQRNARCRNKNCLFVGFYSPLVGKGGSLFLKYMRGN